MPSVSSFAASIDLSAVDNSSVDLTATNKLRIKPEYEAANISNPIAEHECELITLQANASITPFTHDTLIADTFSDADGYKNTCATGTTTAIFSTNKYLGFNITTTNDATSATGNASSLSTEEGLVIHTNAACRLVDVTAISGTNFTKAYLKSIDKTLLATADVTGGVATFNYDLANNTNYIISGDKQGSSYTYDRGSLLSSPQTHTNMNVIGQFSSDTPTTSGNYYIRNFSYIKTGVGTSGTKIIDITLPSISGTVVATELVCNCPERETGDSVTYKLKNATQNDNTLALNTKNTLVNLTTNPTGIEIQITPKSSSPTTGYPSVKTYCLKIWKA